MWLVWNDYSAKYCPVTINAYQAIKTRGLIAKVTIISISNRAKNALNESWRFSLCNLVALVCQVIPRKGDLFFAPTSPLPSPCPLSKLPPFSLEKLKSPHCKFSRQVFDLVVKLVLNLDPCANNFNPGLVIKKFSSTWKFTPRCYS